MAFNHLKEKLFIVMFKNHTIRNLKLNDINLALFLFAFCINGNNLIGVSA